MQIKILITILFSLLNLLILQTKVVAHGIKIIPEINQAISIQAKYDSGMVMNQAQVIVYAPNNPSQPWLTGMTDSQGNFMFIPDPKLSGDWQIKVRQAGHGDIINIPYFPSKIVAEKPAIVSNNSTNNQLINNIPTNNSSILSENYQLQKSLMIASIVWGCVGTALFFARNKSPNFSDSKLSKERNY